MREKPMLDLYPKVIPGPPRPSRILTPSSVVPHSGKERYEVPGNGAILIRRPDHRSDGNLCKRLLWRGLGCRSGKLRGSGSFGMLAKRLFGPAQSEAGIFLRLFPSP